MALVEELADGVADSIAGGALRPGDRLPTHREFARRHQIALTTASRVYAELVRRGLIMGEVGRGTFVRESPPRPVAHTNEPSSGPVDLEYNFPLDDAQRDIVMAALRRFWTSPGTTTTLGAATPAGTRELRSAVRSGPLRGRGLAAETSMAFTGNGRQALAASLAAVARTGERLGVERFTFPVIRGIAELLGIELVPLDIDADGVDPAAVRAAHRISPLAAVYVQPYLHNPRGVDLTARRSVDLARAAADCDLVVIEDAVYSFLHDRPFFAAIAPERTIVVDSMSKRLTPGVTLGFAAAPASLCDRVATAARRGGWAPMSFAVDATRALIDDGTVASVVGMKRVAARERQRAARAELNGSDIDAHPLAFHLWWNLPPAWRADTFVAAAARAGISVTPAADFLVGTAPPPHAIRLALASPPMPDLVRALRTLRALSLSSPDDAHAE